MKTSWGYAKIIRAKGPYATELGRARSLVTA